MRCGLCTELGANGETLAGGSDPQRAAWDDLLSWLPFSSEEFPYSHLCTHIYPNSQAREIHVCSSTPLRGTQTHTSRDHTASRVPYAPPSTQSYFGPVHKSAQHRVQPHGHPRLDRAPSCTPGHKHKKMPASKLTLTQFSLSLSPHSRSAPPPTPP